MLISGRRKLAFILAICSLLLPCAYANDAPPPASPDSVTGGSPEPTSPNIVELVLSLLHVE